ncbi:MAG: RICIN domain-containing protein [Bacteroidales bacterium]|nr:RICIN domain-containing protein [Candidatus Liminaster caballi]
MKHTVVTIFAILSLPLLGGVKGGIFAQERNHSSMYLAAPAISSTYLHYSTDTEIAECAIPATPIKWGMDVAWNSRSNVHRGTNFIGTDVLSIGRVSFQPSDLVDADGNLSAAQINTLNSRLNNIAISGVHSIILNCDHEVLCNSEAYPNCNQNYANYYGKPAEWHKLIKAYVKYCKSKGFTVVAVSPFNEPDYTAWKEGTKSHFRQIAQLISEDPELEGIRISAGNTLNCDKANEWYTYMKPYVTEGNTHQLAGSFDNYAKFWQTVRNDGNYATADELHNTMEAFVGIHYGLQAGVWWGFDGQARGEFCKASFYGKEIGYAENRQAWTAATVYKRPDGRIDAFLGSSERQANTSSYVIAADDRDVYYDGNGPLRLYEMEIPGGTGYQAGQTNAERMIHVQYGEDVPFEPLVSGNEYVIMNKNSKMCFGYYNGANNNGTQLAQGTYTGTNSNTHFRWIYEQVSPRCGGEFSYFILRSARATDQVADIKDWSEDEGGTLIGYTGGLGANEQWFTEYAGDGYYYIRSRHSGLYLEIKGEKTTKNAAIQQAAFKGTDNQRWRFMPTNAALEVVAPAVPQGLKAESQPASVRLSWNANTEKDIAGYQILRGVEADGSVQWDVIGRMVNDTVFVDNGGRIGNTYIYKVRALDVSRNISAASDSVLAASGEGEGLVARYAFENSLTDLSDNMLDAAAAEIKYNGATKKEGESSLNFNGTSAYVLLPAAVGSLPQMSVSMWFNNSNYTSSWVRLFDFGNGTDQYMFLTPSNGSEMRFVMKNHGDEQILSAPKIGTGWHHIMVTIGESEIAIYVDGELKAQTSDITLRPSDLCTMLNYIGRSQFSADPLFKGYIDDFRIYNYALSADDASLLAQGQEPTSVFDAHISRGDVMTETYYNLSGLRQPEATDGLNIVVQRRDNGKNIVIKRIIK